MELASTHFRGVLQAQKRNEGLQSVLTRGEGSYSVLITSVPSAAQSCPTLCDPMDYSPLGSSIHEILQARILECVAISSSRGSSRLRDRTCISCMAGGFFTTEPPGEPPISSEAANNPVAGLPCPSETPLPLQPHSGFRVTRPCLSPALGLGQKSEIEELRAG